MSLFKNEFLFLLLVVNATGCGVRGNPQPPLTPSPLGRGEPSFSKVTENVKTKKKRAPPAEPDWDNSEEFLEESNP